MMKYRASFNKLIAFGFTALEAMDILADKKCRHVVQKLPYRK